MKMKMKMKLKLRLKREEREKNRREEGNRGYWSLPYIGGWVGG